MTWVDIARDDPGPRFGIPAAQAMARFHVRDAAGAWRTGAAGFVVLWEQLHGYRWLASLVRRLRLVSLLDLAYARFARWRLRRRRCGDDGCRAA